MKIRSRFAAGGMAAALAVSGVTATTLSTTWAVAAETGSDEETVTAPGGTTAPDGTSHADRIEDALAGLVEDGTITQEQAMAVAAALASSDTVRGGPHGRGPGTVGIGHGGLGVAAETLGLGEDELRTALLDGSTLAEVAQDQGIAADSLVAALVAAGQERLDQAVADGRIAQAQAEDLAAALPQRVTEQVEGTWEPRTPGRGIRGGITQDSGMDDDGTTSDV